MAAYMTSSELITSVKKRAMIPTSTRTFTDEDFLRFANEEMLLGIVPIVMEAHEEYYVKTLDEPVVANQDSYPIPYRAIGNKLREVKYKNDQGSLFDMARISTEHSQYYQGTQAVNNYQRFYLEDNNIVISPGPGVGATGAIRMYYYMRPNELVSEDRAATITAINTTTGEVSVDFIPDNFTVSVLFDLLQKQSPSKIRAYDLTATGINTVGSIITFSPADLPSTLQVGDYVCQSEECIIPQIPTDLHVVLAQRVACRCLEALGDQQGLQAANAKLQEMELKMRDLIDTRVEGANLKIMNWFSPLRATRFKWGRWGGQ